MNASDSDPTTPRGDWQAEPEKPRSSKTRIYARRIILTLLLGASLTVLGLIIWLLFRQPTTHFVVLRAGGLSVLNGPPSTVSGTDLSFLQPLGEVPDLSYHEPGELDDLFTSPNTMTQLQQRLEQLNFRGNDKFILYVTAQGIDLNGQAYLVCNNFDPSEPGRGVFPVRGLLNQVKEALPEDSTKLVIIDAGQYDYDPRLGMVVNRFPRLLEDIVRQLDDPSLWVLCSHSVAQRSHLSRALGGSVFGTFVTQGLLGYANDPQSVQDNRTLNPLAPDSITVEELERFVNSSVSAWVEQSTGEKAGQTPRLFWFGPADASSANLLPVPKQPDNELTAARMIRDAEQESQQRTTVARRTTGRGLLSRLPSTEGATTGQGQQGTTEAAAADAAPSAGEGQATEEAQPDIHQRLRLLLTQAWKVRDQLAAAPADKSLQRAVDDTPHLWRELQEELVGYEHQAMTADGENESLNSIALLLEQTLPMFSREVADQAVLVRNLTELGTVAPPPQPSSTMTEARTLALASLATKQGWLTPIDNVDELSAQLDSLLELAPLEFAQQIGEKSSWEPVYDRYYELRLVKELAALDLDPELAQLAIRTRRDGELAATSAFVSADWLMQDVLDGDRYRLAGERQMIDQMGENWPQQAKENLERARVRYRAAEKETREIEQAIRLRNDLVFETPYFLRWHRATHANWTEDALQEYDALNRFLDLLAQLSDAIDTPTQDGVATIKQLSQNLTRIRNQQIQVQTSQFNLQSPKNGDAWGIDRLLDTPLPKAAQRQQLLSQARDVDADIARGFDLNLGSEPSTGLEQLQRLCGLEVQVARLSGWPTDPSLIRLQNAYASLTAADKSSDAEQWEKYGEFSTALSQFYASQRDLLKNAEDGEPAGSTRDEARIEAIRVGRALRLLDARDAGTYREIGIRDATRRLTAHDVLKWQLERFSVAQADAPDADRRFLDQAIAAYQLQAFSLLRPSSADQLVPTSMNVDVPRRLSLVQQSTRDLPVSLTYLGAGEVRSWLILAYDPELIEVSAPENVYHEHQLPLRMKAGLAEETTSAESAQARARRALQYPYRPDLVGLAPTFETMRNGDTRTLSLRIAAKSNRVDDAQLLVKAIVPTGSDSIDPQTYLRWPVELNFRTFDLAVEGPPSSWSTSGDQITIYPFPNRLTEFRFGVTNHGQSARDVALSFYVPKAAVQLQELSPEAIFELLNAAELANRVTLEQVQGTRYMPGAAKEAAGEDSSEPSAEETPMAEAAAEPAPPTGPILEHGLLIELSDPNDSRFRFVQQLNVVAQRPRRYVQPRVRYNARLERIDVSVTARDPSLVPTGPIPVECDVAEELPSGIDGKLRDTISASKPLAKLFVNVPAIPAQEVTLQLHVDGYPRAFVYKVPCGAETVDIGEETELMLARMVKPDSIDGFQAPSLTTPIELQIDAPVGSFETPGDFVLLSLDEDFDNKLDVETALRFDTDRQVNAHIQSLAEGSLVLDTRVSDFAVPLSTRKLRNVDIDVLGELYVGTDGGPARSLTLRIDGDAPRIYRVTVSPPGGNILTGEELGISVWARDGMSRIKTVEAAFDLDGTGQFSESAEVVKASFDPLVKRWTAKLSTEKMLGAQTLLVRATDIVGNTSEPFSVRIRVLSPEQIAVVNVIQPKVVRGIVTYTGKRIENVDVTLVKPDGSALQPIKTDEQGQFLFSRVPPGEYALVARGVHHNVPRRGTRDIVIDSDPGRVVHADIELE